MTAKHFKIPLIIILSLAFLVIIAPSVQAASILPDCAASGTCTLCNVLEVLINVGKFLLGLVGSLALLMFVYGGFVWLTSRGESEKIVEGKKILLNAVIGIVITFSAYVVVAFVVNALTAQTGFQWNVELTCAKLPGLPPLNLENRNATSSGNKQLGDPCTSSNECELSLYCDKSTTKCAEKLGNYPGVPNGNFICTGKEISGNDNLACQSTSCANWFDDAFSDGCYKNYCCATSLVSAGNVCNDIAGEQGKQCGNGLYCQTNQGDLHNGTCQKQKNKNGTCLSSNIVGGNASDICANGRCDRSICLASAGEGEIGDWCTDTRDDCKNPCFSQASKNCLFCHDLADGSRDGRGKCSPPLLKDAVCEDDAVAKCLGGTLCNNFSAPCEGDYSCVAKWSITDDDTCVLP
jgi:hypothetical protein